MQSLILLKQKAKAGLIDDLRKLEVKDEAN